MRHNIVVLALVCAWLAPNSAAAQRPTRPPRNPKKPPSTGTAGRTQLPARSFAAWLEDADTLEPGSVSMGLSVGRWESLDGGETDGPVFDAAAGVTPRIQVSASIPYYRASYSDGFAAQGLGDTYLAAKVQLLDAGEYGVGIAVLPIVEILSEAAVSDTTLGLSRVNWGIPVSVQVGSDETRAYGTAGYFSRGAVFGGAALERAISERVTLAATLTYTHATRTNAASDLAGLSRSRTDAAGGVYFRISRAVTISAGAGRTVSAMDQNGARLTANAGISILMSRHASRPE